MAGVAGAGWADMASSLRLLSATEPSRLSIVEYQLSRRDRALLALWNGKPAGIFRRNTSSIGFNWKNRRSRKVRLKQNDPERLAWCLEPFSQGIFSRHCTARLRDAKFRTTKRSRLLLVMLSFHC